MKNGSDSTQVVMDIGPDDWIVLINGELNDGFINYM